MRGRVAASILLGLILLVTLAIVLPPTEAQQAGKALVGYVTMSSPARPQRVEAFRAALRELGYEEGVNLALRVVYAEGRVDRLDEVITEAVADADVLVTTFTPGAHAAKRSAGRIPIVMAGVSNPVGGGLVASLGRPGGNITGITYDAGIEMGSKRLELLKELLPGMKRVVLLWDIDVPGMADFWGPVEQWAQRNSVELRVLKPKAEADVPDALAEVKRLRPDALFVAPTPAIAAQRTAILTFALRHRLPTAATVKQFNGGRRTYVVPGGRSGSRPAGGGLR